jgi:hypothetical protein
MELSTQFLWDEVLFLFCQLIFGVFFVEDIYFTVDQDVIIGPCLPIVPEISEAFFLSEGTMLRPRPLSGPRHGCSLFGHAQALWFLPTSEAVS